MIIWRVCRLFHAYRTQPRVSRSVKVQTKSFIYLKLIRYWTLVQTFLYVVDNNNVVPTLSRYLLTYSSELSRTCCARQFASLDKVVQGERFTETMQSTFSIVVPDLARQAPCFCSHENESKSDFVQNREYRNESYRRAILHKSRAIVSFSLTP